MYSFEEGGEEGQMLPLFYLSSTLRNAPQVKIPQGIWDSSLVEHFCFEVRIICCCTTTYILPPVTERLLFLGQMLHVSLRRSW